MAQLQALDIEVLELELLSISLILELLLTMILDQDYQVVDFLHSVMEMVQLIVMAMEHMWLEVLLVVSLELLRMQS